MSLRIVLRMGRWISAERLWSGHGPLMKLPVGHSCTGRLVLHAELLAEETNVPEEIDGEGDALGVFEQNETEGLLALCLAVGRNTDTHQRTRLEEGCWS